MALHLSYERLRQRLSMAEHRIRLLVRALTKLRKVSSARRHNQGGSGASTEQTRRSSIPPRPPPPVRGQAKSPVCVPSPCADGDFLDGDFPDVPLRVASHHEKVSRDGTLSTLKAQASNKMEVQQKFTLFADMCEEREQELLGMQCNLTHRQIRQKDGKPQVEKLASGDVVKQCRVVADPSLLAPSPCPP